VVVVSDAMLAYLSELRGMAQELREVGAAVGTILRTGGLPLGGRPCIGQLQFARLRVGEAASSAADLAHAIHRAVEDYGVAEARAEREQQLSAASLAALGGPAIWLFALSLLGWAPALASAAGFWAGVGLLTGTDPLGAVRRGVFDDQRALTDPAVVRAVELGAVSLDELGASTAGVPAPLALLLGDEGLGILGVNTTAAGAISAGAAFGVLRETPVRIDRTQISTGGLPPSGVADRFARIPEGDQVRIERYEAPGEPPAWLVYVGPTETFSPVAGDEPWDQTSNIAAVAGQSAGSIRATELAMAEAGIRPGDDVQFMGYSQGGLVAARLAGSGTWNVVGLETFGAPTGSIELAAGLPGIAVRHTDDLVPALGGPHPVSGQLQLEREAYPRGVPIPDDEPLPAHQRSAYQATAQAIDQATSAEVRAELARLDAVPQEYAARPGSTVTTWTFHAERVPTGDGR
jgi:hypothetical protein